MQGDRVTNRAGKDLNRSFGLADRGRPRECQYSPGMLSAWQGADVCNQLALEIVEVGFNKGLTSQDQAIREVTQPQRALGLEALRTADGSD